MTYEQELEAENKRRAELAERIQKLIDQNRKTRELNENTSRTGTDSK